MSISIGRRPVARCTRALMSAVKPAHADSTSADEAYWGSRLVSVGTMSALARLTGVLHPTFGSRVGRLTGQHRDAVIPAEGHRGAVADRDPGDMSDCHGLFVVGQQVGRGAPDDPEDAVQAGEHAGGGAVPQSHDDAVAAPRQPRHQQHDLAAGDEGSVSEVVLQPQSGFGDPGSVHACVAHAPLGFDLCQGSPGGAVGAGVSQRHQLVVGFVAADLAFDSTTHVSSRSCQSSIIRARRVAGGSPASRVFDGLLHGVVRAPAQLGGGAVGPGQVVGIEYFHEFSVRLQVGLSWGFRFD